MTPTGWDQQHRTCGLEKDAREHRCPQRRAGRCPRPQQNGEATAPGLHAHQFRACGFYIFDAFNSNWARKAFETASHMFVVCIQARDNRRLTPSPGRGGRYHDSVESTGSTSERR